MGGARQRRDVAAARCHHDYHHRFSNYGRNAKNYGEGFWFWDWAFGTLSDPRKLAKIGDPAADARKRR